LGATTASTIAGTTLSTTGLATIASSAFVTGRSIPSSGAGLEIFYSSNLSYLLSYDRTGSAYKALTLDGTTTSINSSGSQIAQLASTGCTFKGTTTNDNAATGYIGEFASATLNNASKVTLTNATSANVISVSLTAGDWETTGVVYFQQSGSTPTAYYGNMSSTSADIGSSNFGENVSTGAPVTTAAQVIGGITPPTRRFSLSATTTIYLVAYADFAAGSLFAYGTIRARRMR
jgi:hypothetical protein